MVEVKEALACIRQYSDLSASIKLPIERSFGRVLREEFFADRDQPPFHRVAMDGIAFQYKSYQNGKREFRLNGVAAAGAKQMSLQENESCIEVMTGAVLPIGCDCVVKIEELIVKDGVAHLVESASVAYMQNIHQQGTDYKKGDSLLKPGCRLLGPQLAVAATIGKAQVSVNAQPSVAIINTGDELVDVWENPQEHQIRRSNAYAIQAEFNLLGYRDVHSFHLKDDRETLELRLKEIIDQYDLVVLSGGVSMGKFDFIPSVLKELNVTERFHKIRQKPGKPMWFGSRPADRKLVFALPGNPVSALICFRKYVVECLNILEGSSEGSRILAQLTEDIETRATLENYIPVQIQQECGSFYARPVAMNGSGDYACLAQSDGFLQLPSGQAKHTAGERYEVYFWGQR